MEKLVELKALLASPQKVTIVTHFKPDADALGSSLGLAGFLKNTGHRVSVVTPSDFPDFLAWLPGSHEVIALSKHTSEPLQKATLAFQTADIIFCLDFSNLSRINDLADIVRKAPGKKVMVDHHLEPEPFSDFQKWSVQAASTAQLVFELINELGGKAHLDAAIATCLYAGLMTDTGSFRHNNTTAREMAVASELISLGANPSEVARLIYDVNSLSRLKLIGYALYKNLVVYPEYHTACITLSQEELKMLNVQTGDTEGLVNYGLSLKDVRLAVLMYDRGEEIKISFRSLGDFSVNDLARKHFEGGGHKNAAGGSSKLTLEQTMKKFLDLLPQYKTSLS
ncbi:MAG: bifunctional oligoribonuclease/PAP phosphatase NrnA [Bacteroidetes bacterium]|nr:bifunctional oligoribonuclease/PAP phosphatase NrnA [Bacteroidota bacterium]MBS1541592.1 bifunctional oligoribonuclease/PAP phosphatase NrnA [Bacteroidota bacterium]